MPGYTHLQPAMPSSVGMWLHSMIEASITLIREGLHLLDVINANPLGASAGFGSNIPLDREYTAQLLGFSRVQRSPIDCNNSRGLFEQRVLSFSCSIVAMFEKLGWDMVLYTTREFGFFKLPNEMTTGSSIMPQKRNSDIAELLRSRGGKVRAARSELDYIITKLPSSYSRDLQYTKEPVQRADFELNAMFRMANLIIERFTVNAARLKECLYSDMYSTYEANRLSMNGEPYRSAYKKVAAHVLSGEYDKTEFVADFKTVQDQTNKYVEEARLELLTLTKEIETWHEKEGHVVDMVFSSSS